MSNSIPFLEVKINQKIYLATRGLEDISNFFSNKFEYELKTIVNYDNEKYKLIFINSNDESLEVDVEPLELRDERGNYLTTIYVITKVIAISNKEEDLTDDFVGKLLYLFPCTIEKNSRELIEKLDFVIQRVELLYI